MAFNPLANSFDTTYFTVPEGTHRFKIVGTKLRKQKWGAGEAYLLDITTRIEQGNSDTEGKVVNYSNAVATFDPATSDARTDENGNPVVDFKKVAEVVHAAFGYANNDKQEDARFLREKGNLDLGVDFAELTLGSGYEELNDCSFIADITHQQDKKDPNKIYARFNKVRSVK